jgi:hypothetical protein
MSDISISFPLWMIAWFLLGQVAPLRFRAKQRLDHLKLGYQRLRLPREQVLARGR